MALRNIGGLELGNPATVINSQGGFSWWPGGGTGPPWNSIGHPRCPPYKIVLWLVHFTANQFIDSAEVRDSKKCSAREQRS